MPTKSETVEARLKIVVDASGTRVIDTVTGRLVAASKAEDLYAAAVKKRLTVQQEADRQAFRSALRQQEDAHQAAVRAELVRRGVTGEPTVADRVRGVVEQNRQATWERFQQRQVNNDLRAMGLNPDGSRRTLLDRAGIAGGLARQHLGPAGVLAAGYGAGQFVNDTARIEGTPFLSAREKDEQKGRAAPLGAGRVFGFFKDLQRSIRGETEQIGQTVESSQVSRIRIGLQAEQRQRGDEVDRQAASAQSRAAEFGSGFKLDRPQGFDRGTVEGERRFREEQRLLPIRQQLTVAAKERAAAERDVARATEVEAQKKREVEQVERKIQTAIKERRAASQTDGSPSGAALDEAGAAANVGDLAAERKQRLKELEEASRKRLEAEGKANTAKGVEGQKRVEFYRAQTEIAAGREEQSAAGAQSLSQLGQGGRELAKQGLDLINQGIPLDQIPDDLLNAARAAAPDTVRKAEEKYGEQFKEDFRSRAPGEDRLRDRKEAQGNYDRSREDQTKAEEDELKRSANDTAQSTARFAASIKDLLKMLTDVAVEIETLKANGIISRAGQSG